MAMKTLPFVALGVFGGPIGMALGMVSLAASSHLPEFQGREVKHLQLHLAYGMVAGACLKFGISLMQRQVSTGSIASLITQGGIWGIASIWLKRQLAATPPPAPPAGGQPPQAPSPWGQGQPLGTS